MTATQPLETLKAGLQISVGNIKRRLSGRVLFGTVAVLAALFFIGMFPRWRANAALTSSVRDQRPTVGVISSEHPGNDANLVLPGSTQAIQETAIYARTNGYVKQWNVDIGARVEAGQLLAEIETPEVDQELNQARANVTQAIANSDLARATLTRWKDLADKKVVSEQEFDEKKSAADARAADLKVAQANVKRLEELQGFEKIIAPRWNRDRPQHRQWKPCYGRQWPNRSALPPRADRHAAHLCDRAANAGAFNRRRTKRNRLAPRNSGQNFQRKSCSHRRRHRPGVSNIIDRAASA